MTTTPSGTTTRPDGTGGRAVAGSRVPRNGQPKCEACNGSGKDAKGRDCRVCGGTGIGTDWH